MRIFKVFPKPRWGQKGDGRYTWRTPVVRCGTCNRLVGASVGYATLDITGKLDEEAFTLRAPGDPGGNRGSVSRAEFDELAAPLQQLAGKEKVVFPGMGFGPFRGSVTHSEKRDFVWVWQQELIVRDTTYERLAQVGVEIDTGPAIIRDRRTNEIRSDYQRIVELRIVNCIASQTLEFADFKRCAECGLSLTKTPEKLLLKKSSVPKDALLFMPEHIFTMLAKEEFVGAVTDLGLNNIAFEPVELV